MADTDVITNVVEKTKVAIRAPSKFNVVLYNDDVTTVQFVVMVLMNIFYKSLEDATELCLQIHNNGKGIAGTYTFEIASQKREEVQLLARAYQFPLFSDVEEV